MLVERYVERGRHVEVQVLADAFGTVVHLFDRDCSVQRRHQKVVEEAPAPTISGRGRESVTAAAVRLAREVGYVNAGTVEFLVAGDGGEQRAYFLEMNTRLQVEHPVTELVTGVDLVRLQFDVAQGRPLPVRQEQVTLTGHAMEARVYAEDPHAGFLPQAGVARRVRWSPRARVDGALEDGQRVESWYDPLLGKVVVHGETREAARRALVDALDDTAILGLTTNLGFLRRLVASDEYRDAALDTAWLDRHPEAFPQGVPDIALCAAAWALATAGSDPRHPFGVLDGWRAAGAPADVLVELEQRGDRHVLRVDRPRGVVEELALADQQVHRRWAVHEVAADRGQLRLEIDGLVHEVLLEADRHGATVSYRGDAFTFVRPDLAAATAAEASGDGLVVAPMPGTVLTVHVEKGASVVAGEVLAVMEAMKMELPLRAPFDGAVDEITAVPGQQVPLGQALFAVVPHAAAEDAT
jgi:acetyl-CoA/propionyl-CoA carboxylase, biotin carboxylase, biotin carboxyl carrier protein